MPNYAGLRNHKKRLIRKALQGSVFLADYDADPIEELTAKVGNVISLKQLPTGWDDLGTMSKDGGQWSRDTDFSEVESWGYREPTRRDKTQDSKSLQVVCQETKARTIALGLGVDLAALVPDADTGEVRVAIPDLPEDPSYRALALGVDNKHPAGEIYAARFLPAADPTDFGDQSMADGDDPYQWDVTLTGRLDDELGYASMDLFGGPGWHALLADMGFHVT